MTNGLIRLYTVVTVAWLLALGSLTAYASHDLGAQRAQVVAALRAKGALETASPGYVAPMPDLREPIRQENRDGAWEWWALRLMPLEPIVFAYALVAGAWVYRGFRPKRRSALHSKSGS